MLSSWRSYAAKNQNESVGGRTPPRSESSSWLSHRQAYPTQYWPTSNCSPAVLYNAGTLPSFICFEYVSFFSENVFYAGLMACKMYIWWIYLEMHFMWNCAAVVWKFIWRISWILNTHTHTCGHETNSPCSPPPLFHRHWWAIGSLLIPHKINPPQHTAQSEACNLP